MGYELFDKDWLFILEAIFKLNSTTNVKSFQRKCLEMLRVLISCSQAVFFLAERRNGKIYSYSPVSFNVPEENLKKFMEDRYDDDDYFKGYYFDYRTKVFRDTDMSSDEFRLNTRMYRDIYLNENVFYALRAALVCQDTLLGYIALFRPKTASDFSDNEMRILSILTDHITLQLHKLLNSNKIKESYDGEDFVNLKYIKDYDLTKRESQVAAMIKQGKTDAEIADKLYISMSTLKKHIHKIYRKTNTNNRVQLIKRL
jgi:DNA-binding CsgD family transcriptional regulator